MKLILILTLLSPLMLSAHNQTVLTPKLLASFSCGRWQPLYGGADWKRIAHDSTHSFRMRMVNGRGQPVIKLYNLNASIMSITAEAATINYSVSETENVYSNVHRSYIPEESAPTINTVTLSLDVEHTLDIIVNRTSTQMALKIVVEDQP